MRGKSHPLLTGNLFLTFTEIIFTINQTFGPLNSRICLVCILLTDKCLLRQESQVAFLSCSSSEITDVETPFPHVRGTPASKAWMKLPLQWPLSHVTCWPAVVGLSLIWELMLLPNTPHPPTADSCILWCHSLSSQCSWIRTKRREHELGVLKSVFILTDLANTSGVYLWTEYSSSADWCRKLSLSLLVSSCERPSQGLS